MRRTLQLMTIAIAIGASVLSARHLSSDSELPDFRMFPYSARKRIIHHGWSMPTAAWAAANLSHLEEKPFDGLVLPPGDEIAMLFDHGAWAERKIDSESLARIGQGRFTDNLLLVFCNEEFATNYFNDRQWEQICRNMTALAKAAKEHNFAGFFLDVESYEGAPFSSEEMRGGRTRKQLQLKVRQRGREVVRAIQATYPDIVILMTACFAYVPPEWDLLPWFVNGMLDELGPAARLIEGDEESYYWGTTNRWFSRYADLKTGKQSLMGDIAPENLDKYHSQVEVGKAVYSRQCFFAKDAYELEQELPRDWQLKKWRHNIYMGLATTDRYLWCYTERMNLLGTPPDRQPMGWAVEPADWTEATSAIADTRQQYDEGEPLGWDMHSRNLWKPGTPDSSIAVTLRLPEQDAEYRAPAKVELEAQIEQGEARDVVFYCNVIEVGRSPVSSATMSLSDLPVGRYTFFARVFDATGNHGTSAPVEIIVGP